MNLGDNWKEELTHENAIDVQKCSWTLISSEMLKKKKERKVGEAKCSGTLKIKHVKLLSDLKSERTEINFKSTKVQVGFKKGYQIPTFWLTRCGTFFHGF